MVQLRRIFRTLAFFSSIVFLGLLILPTLPFKLNALQMWRLRMFSLWSRHILKVIGISLQDNQFSRTQSPEQARIIISNHVSYLDIPVIAALGPTLFLAKSEVEKWPLIGWISSALGMLFVERARLKQRALSIEKIAAQLKNGFNVAIFPEGTTSLTGPQLGRVPYFAGAFRAARENQSPIEVLYLEYSPEEAAAWIGDASFFGHLWKLLAGPKIHVKVRREILPKITLRGHQAQSYFWSRAWMLGGGHGIFNSRSIEFSNPKLDYLIYEARKKTSNIPYNLKDPDR